MFDSALIKEEQGLIKKFGLKNRREVWKAGYAINKIRNLAKKLITSEEKIKQEFIKREAEKGFNVNSIAEILGLSKTDYLKRRLQSIVVSKGFASTHKQARQLITHKHIKINGNCINSPSHLTTIEEEASLECDLNLGKKVISDEEKELLAKIKPHGEK